MQKNTLSQLQETFSSGFPKNNGMKINQMNYIINNIYQINQKDQNKQENRNINLKFLQIHLNFHLKIHLYPHKDSFKIPKTPEIPGIQKMPEIPEQPETLEFSQQDKEINEPSHLWMESLSEIKKQILQPIYSLKNDIYQHSRLYQNDNTQKSEEKIIIESLMIYVKIIMNKCDNQGLQIFDLKIEQRNIIRKANNLLIMNKFKNVFFKPAIHLPHTLYRNNHMIPLLLVKNHIIFNLAFRVQIKPKQISSQKKKSSIYKLKLRSIQQNKEKFFFKTFHKYLNRITINLEMIDRYCQDDIKLYFKLNEKLSTIQHQRFNHNFISEINMLGYQHTIQRSINQQQLKHRKYGQKIKQHSDDPIYHELFNYNSEGIAIIIKCLPLKLTGTILSFQHNSIQEFIYAKFIITNLLAISSIINQYKQLKANITLQNFKINMNSQKLKKNQFILICIQIYLFNNLDQQSNKDTARDIFIDQFNSVLALILRELKIYQSTNDLLSSIDISPLNILHFLILISKISSKFINISSNSIQLLTYLQELFYEKSFCEIQIKDVKLLGFNCIGCDFTKSKLENVTTEGTNLYFCKIAEAEWKDIISQNLPTFSFNIGPIIKALFSFDGQYIASPGLQQNLVIYQIFTCCSNTKSTLVYFYKETLNILSFYEDQKQNDINIVQSNEIEVNQQHIKFKFKINDSVVLIKFSNQDSYLLVGCQKGKIFIYKFLNQQFTLFSKIQGRSRKIFDFYSDENSLIACDQNQNYQNIYIRLLSNKNHKAKLVGHKNAVRCVCFPREGNILVSGGDDKMFEYGIICKNLHGHFDVIYSIEFSKPNGTIILSAGKDGLIKQWNHSDNYHVSEYLPGYEGSILFMVLSQDSQRIITKGKDKKIIQWNIETASVVNQMISLQSSQEFSINKLYSSCQLSPIIIVNDDQHIITDGFGHSISIFDIYTCNQTNFQISYLRPKGEVIILAQSQKQNLICSRTKNGEIKIQDSFNGRQFTQIEILRKFQQKGSMLSINI
ncbi:unnamed protein product [Paramecium primaurelia]|uniref:WD domain, G-beta repeat protein n=1 Tax=Paramecium primaurelia TaxID=5886 RepID=A0A8S1NYG1_PARPR|nr:unnamed protein product [Paramecium primaurelia]